MLKVTCCTLGLLLALGGVGSSTFAEEDPLLPDDERSSFMLEEPELPMEQEDFIPQDGEDPLAPEEYVDPMAPIEIEDDPIIQADFELQPEK